jgi:hypothetical protein
LTSLLFRYLNTSNNSTKKLLQTVKQNSYLYYSHFIFLYVILFYFTDFCLGSYSFLRFQRINKMIKLPLAGSRHVSPFWSKLDRTGLVGQTERPHTLRHSLSLSPSPSISLATARRLSHICCCRQPRPPLPATAATHTLN